MVAVIMAIIGLAKEVLVQGKLADTLAEDFPALDLLNATVFLTLLDSCV